MLSQWYLDALKVLEQPKLNLWQWADKYRVLTKETSSEAGRWNTARTPYMYEPMEVIGNKTTQQVVIMSSAQVGKSELILNMCGNIIHLNPRPFIIIQPTVDMAQSFSEERLTPMLNSTPCLKGKVSDNKSRDKQNTKSKKSFDGGFLALIGTNAPAPLAGRSVGVILADEIDRYPASAGVEGDPLNLAMKRATTFFDRKIILVSTPTIKGASRIEQLYNEGSQGQWTLPCPECGEYQPLLFDYFDLNTLEMLCTNCGCLSTEFAWKKRSKEGKWIHHHPERDNKSYHLNAFTSPWVKWSEIADEYHQAKKNGEEQYKVFVNTTLGLPYELEGDAGDPKKLYDMRESYNKVPNEVLELTCGIDTQDDRLEYEIKGWGENEENWGIEKGIILGRPSEFHVWDTLYNVLTSSYEKEDGTFLNIAMSFMDSGGHYTSDVYEKCSRLMRKGVRIFPIKGVGRDSTPIIDHVSKLPQYGTKLVHIGVNSCKEKILQITNPESEYFKSHFTNDPNKNYSLEYFNQLFSERKVEKRVNGNIVFMWECVRKRNEALDCFVYAYAAYVVLNMRPKTNSNKSKVSSKSFKVKERDVYND